MLATHHARVAIMALRLGANLKIDGEALIALGMAGCLFDLGLGALPGAASLAPEALPHDHPLHSAELIRRWEPPYPGIVDAVAQHHEREHGRGYPAGTSGEAIHLHAKILGLLDQYTRLARSGDVRGLSAAAIGKTFVTHVALDSAADAAKAVRALKKL